MEQYVATESVVFNNQPYGLFLCSGFLQTFFLMQVLVFGVLFKKNSNEVNE